jgi:hypothetical protein
MQDVMPMLMRSEERVGFSGSLVRFRTDTFGRH